MNGRVGYIGPSMIYDVCTLAGLPFASNSPPCGCGLFHPFFSRKPLRVRTISI